MSDGHNNYSRKPPCLLCCPLCNTAKMLAQFRLPAVVAAAAPAAAAGARLLAVNVRSPTIIRCSSHSATSSEDASGKPFVTVLTAGGHTFKGDLGSYWGGGGTAPEPKDYAYAALALCTSVTVRLYADKKNWPLKHVEVEVQEVNGRPGKVPDGLHAVLKLEGDLTELQKNELIRISANCPVKQIFSGKIKNGITSALSESLPPT